MEVLDPCDPPPPHQYSQDYGGGGGGAEEDSKQLVQSMPTGPSQKMNFCVAQHTGTIIAAMLSGLGPEIYTGFPIWEHVLSPYFVYLSSNICDRICNKGPIWQICCSE